MDVYDDRQVRAIFTLQLDDSFLSSSLPARASFGLNVVTGEYMRLGGSSCRGLKPTDGRNYRTFGRTQAIQMLHLQSIDINSTLLTE